MPAAIHVYSTEAERIARAVSEAAPERTVVPLATPEELEATMAEVCVLFAGFPPRDGWARAERLRLVQLMGAGVDGLLPSGDLPAEVQVASASSVFATEVSEHAMAMLLSLCRGLPALVERQRDRRWAPFGSRTLAGRTLGILGLGQIGRRIARAARALDMTVVGARRHPCPTDHVSTVYGPDELPALLSRSDYLVIALPLTPETRGLLDGTALTHLPRDATVVNVARGAIVDEAALVARLESGELGGAALDVFAKEPLPEDSPLWSAPNTLVTPHVAGRGVDYLGRVVELLVENTRRLDAGEPLLHEVNRELGY